MLNNLDSYLVIYMCPCSSRGCRINKLINEFKFGQINERKNGKNPKRCKAKSSQNSGADIRKLRSVLKRRIYKYLLCYSRKISSSPRCIIQSCVYREECTELAAVFLRKVFFFTLLFACLHTHYSEEPSFPWSCASDVSNNVSSRKW